MQVGTAATLPAQVVIAGHGPDARTSGLTSLRPRPAGAGLAVVGTLALAHASYLVAHPDRPWLFVAEESEQGRVSSVRAEHDGTLTLLSSVATGGSGSCHVALTADAGHVLVADYGSGTVCAVVVGPDGRLGRRSGFWRLEGSGPDLERQSAPHAHQVVVDGTEVLVADLGSDRVHRLRVDDDGTLQESGPAVSLPPGSGPRHLVVVEDHLVVATELSGELWLGRRSPQGGWTESGRVPCTRRPDAGPTNPSALRAARGHPPGRQPGAGDDRDLCAGPERGHAGPGGRAARGWPLAARPRRHRRPAVGRPSGRRRGHRREPVVRDRGGTAPVGPGSGRGLRPAAGGGWAIAWSGDHNRRDDRRHRAADRPVG